MNQFKLSARTNKGMVRDHNEDNFIVAKDIAGKNWTDLSSDIFSGGEMGALLVVADGMGGTEAGEVASEIAVRSIKDWFIKIKEVPASDRGIRNELSNAILSAHQNIVADAEENPERFGMGTTIVIAWVLGNKAHIAWSGDSRAYAYRAATHSLELLTDDHSLVWDYVKKDQLSPEEARVHPDSNIINQSLGDKKHPPKPDVVITNLQQDDILMLCSDGLNGMLSDPQLEMIFQAEKDISILTERLIQSANEAGGTDNITIAAIRAVKLSTPILTAKGITRNPILLAIPLALIVIIAFTYAIWPSGNRGGANDIAGNGTDTLHIVPENNGTTAHTPMPEQEPEPEPAPPPTEEVEPPATLPTDNLPEEKEEIPAPAPDPVENNRPIETIRPPVVDSLPNETTGQDSIQQKEQDITPSDTLNKVPPPNNGIKRTNPEELAFQEKIRQLNLRAEELYRDIQKIISDVRNMTGTEELNQTERDQLKALEEELKKLVILDGTNKVKLMEHLVTKDRIDATSQKIKEISEKLIRLKAQHEEAINN